MDGLRGVAAFSVLMMHLYFPFEITILARAYLAVDFFFLLSGFVICYAYEEKLQGDLSVLKFMLIRGIRLYPLICLGVILGAIVALLKVKSDEYHELAAAFALGLLVLPSPFFQRLGSESYYPLNLPTWSLFYEIVGNFFYALIVPFLSRQKLVLLIVVSGVLFTWTVLFCGTVNVGASSENFIYGFPRFSFSFLLGVLLFKIHRHRLFESFHIGLGILSLSMVAVFCIPLGWGIISDFVFIVLISPAIVLAAANSNITKKSLAFCQWAGRMSYPVYIVQYPFVRVVGHFARDHIPTSLQLYFLTAAAIGIVLVSWILLAFFDEPLRNRLTQLSKGVFVDAKSA